MTASWSCSRTIRRGIRTRRCGRLWRSVLPRRYGWLRTREPDATRGPDPGSESMPRLNPVDRIPDDLAVHMRSVPGVPGRVSNVYATVARNPAMFPAFCVFADAVNRRGKLSDRLRERVVLRVGWLSGAEYEFGHHTVRALSVGFTTEEIRRITQPR